MIRIACTRHPRITRATDIRGREWANLGAAPRILLHPALFLRPFHSKPRKEKGKWWRVECVETERQWNIPTDSMPRQSLDFTSCFTTLRQAWTITWHYQPIFEKFTTCHSEFPVPLCREEQWLQMLPTLPGSFHRAADRLMGPRHGWILRSPHRAQAT